MALWTNWQQAPKVLDRGKSKRIVTTTNGEPVVTITSKKDDSGIPHYEASSDTWYHSICDCSASFHIPGLTLEAAQIGANELTTHFTRTKSTWKFGVQFKDDYSWDYTWQETPESTTTCESEIAVVPMGGNMYQIQCEIHTQDEKYSKSANFSWSYPPCFDIVP